MNLFDRIFDTLQPATPREMIWADQGAPMKTTPVAVLRPFLLQTHGNRELRVAALPSGDNNKQVYTLTLRVEMLGPDSFLQLLGMVNRLGTMAARVRFEQNKLGRGRIGNINNVAQSVDFAPMTMGVSTPVARAVVDLSIHFSEVTLEDLGRIETVVFTGEVEGSNGEPLECSHTVTVPTED